MAVFKRYKGKKISPSHAEYNKATWQVEFQFRGMSYKKAHPECRTKKDAEDKETLLRNQVMDGSYFQQRQEQKISSEKISTFEGFFKEVYMPWAKLNKKSHKTDEQRGLVLCGYFGKLALEAIKPRDVESFRFYLLSKYKHKNQHISKSTVNRYAALLSKVFSLACYNDLLETNPMRKVKQLGEPSARKRVMSEEEQKKLFPVIREHAPHIMPFVIMVMHTGLRRSEMFKAKVKDVLRDRMELHVPESKSGKERFIPLNDEIAETVLSLMVGLREEDFLFTYEQNKITDTTLKKGWYKVLAKAGIDDLKIHDLRRTFATRLRAQGVPWWEIMYLLGHSKPEVTQGYAYPDAGLLRRAVNSLTEKPAKVLPFANSSK